MVRYAPGVRHSAMRMGTVNIALWTVQIFLALAFIGAGAFKLFFYDKYATSVTKAGSLAVPRTFAGFIGTAEIAGAFGLVLPMAINVAPVLTPWAALALATIMLLAIGYHLRGHESAPAPLTLLLLAAFVAFGRFSQGV